MNDLLKGILGEDTIIPPEVVSGDLKSRFPCSRSIDWFLREKRYEALFYCDGIEYIASYSDIGKFLNYRENIPPAKVPELLGGAITTGEEVMNVVKIVENDKSVSYEMIFRDSLYERFLVRTNSVGQVIDRIKL